MLQQDLDHLLGCRHVGVGETELRELRVTSHEVGHWILELGDDLLEERSIRRCLLVDDHVGGHAELLGNAHGIAGGVSMGVVEDGHISGRHLVNVAPPGVAGHR